LIDNLKQQIKILYFNYNTRVSPTNDTYLITGYYWSPPVQLAPNIMFTYPHKHHPD